MTAPLPTAVLMCHAPIVVPGVAGAAQARRCERSTGAMRDAARRVVGAAPEVVVVVSPHAPRHPRGWLVASDDRVAGDFGRFGIAGIGADVPFARDAAGSIVEAARELGLPCEPHRLGSLDHGTLVPLWFLVEAGWEGPTVRIALPGSPSHAGCETMGRAIARAAERNGRRWALVASGDMSHRLTPDAPAGYAPEARGFDEAVRQRVEAGDYVGVRGIDPDLRELAAEDVVDSLDVAAGALDADATGHELLSYEGPFGVGYLVAVLRSAEA